MDDRQSEDLPPGFGGVTREHGLAPHPASALTFTTLTFQTRPEPWYRSNAAKLTLVVLGLGTAVAALVVLLWPTGSSEPPPRDAGSPSAPSATPTASPTPSAPSSELAPPAPAPPVGLPPGPPPPEPPPLTAEQMAPPAAPPRYYPPQDDDPTQKKPDVDVTRAPISVAPSIKAPTGPSGSAVPGEQRKRRGFF